jgi:hypothetical protein
MVIRDNAQIVDGSETLGTADKVIHYYEMKITRFVNFVDKTGYLRWRGNLLYCRGMHPGLQSS